MRRVFLDANVYFSGFYSNAGASHVILQLISRKKLLLTSSRLVLKEADRNLRAKASGKAVQAFRTFLRNTKIHMIPALVETDYHKFTSIINPKDAPVLAAALKGKVDFLITLDRKDFMTAAVLTASDKMKVITPGDFIRQL